MRLLQGRKIIDRQEFNCQLTWESCIAVNYSEICSKFIHEFVHNPVVYSDRCDLDCSDHCDAGALDEQNL